MSADEKYPSHIYESIRIELATSYIKNEFRKLLWRVPKKYWSAIKRDISDWMKCPNLSNPRDFWNGFHGICMGFKLKIGLIYFVTAENIFWKKEMIPIKKLTFGVELKQTKIIRPGKLTASEVIQFYADPRNKKVKEKQQKLVVKFSRGRIPSGEEPIIVAEKVIDGKLILSVYDGNRRLIKAVLEGKKEIEAFIGRFASQVKEPKNYWLPSSILMEILYFARQAFERKNKKLFDYHMEVLKNMLKDSELAVYELKKRALTRQQPFRNEVLKNIKD